MFLKCAKKQSSGSDFLYFTKFNTDYEHSTSINQNLCMVLECTVYRKLLYKSAALGTLPPP